MMYFSRSGLKRWASAVSFRFFRIQQPGTFSETADKGQKFRVALAQDFQDTPRPAKLLFFAPGQGGDTARRLVFDWSMALKLAGITTEMIFDDKSLKAQMKQANRLGAGKVLMVGEAELAAGTVVLRDMATKTQKDIPVDAVLTTLTEQLNP